MPLPIPKSEPPRPPDLNIPSNGPAISAIITALATLGAYLRQLIVWLNNEITQLREVANWLVQQQNIRNLVPDSDFKDIATYWTVGVGWSAMDAVGAGGGRGFVITGGPTTSDVQSSPIAIRPGGDFYVLSGWLDARDMTGGTLSWLVMDAAGPTIFGEAIQTIGTFSRVQIPFIIPTASSVRVILRAVGVTTGATGVIGSQPQLELPDAPHEGVNTPSATLYRSNVGAH